MGVFYEIWGHLDSLFGHGENCKELGQIRPFPLFVGGIQKLGLRISCDVIPFMMKLFFNRLTVVCTLLLVQTGLGQELKILINHLGYEVDAPKQAILLGQAGDEVTDFKIINANTGKNVLIAPVTKVGPMDQWKNWVFWTADFDAIQTEGTYLLACTTHHGEVRSFPFQIRHGLLEKNTLSDVIYYFKSQRCSGLLDQADRHARYEGTTNTADVHGGWYDATGDYGKHLGGLGFSVYFNMQPTPVADWALFKAY
jgi:hypothetical protein